MELSKAGNKFFKKKLDSYRSLGLSYKDFWKKATDDFIRWQTGGTDQGLQHCRDVENNIWILISKYAKDFPLESLYVLSLSAALHDCAKTGAEVDHALEGAKIIKTELVKNGYVQLQSTADAISFIVLAHTSGDFSSLPDIYDVGGDMEIRLKDTAAIFRLADMMSTSEDRGARLYKILKLKHATLSDFLNSVRLKIQSCRPSQSDRTSLEVRAYADDNASQRNIEAYVDGLNKDLTDDHKKILQNVKLNFLTKSFTHKEKDITMPYQFELSWVPPFPISSIPRTITKKPKTFKMPLLEKPLLNKNYYKVYEDNNHLCVMKQFPTCYIDGAPNDYQKYHLRFYLPKKAISSKENKIDRIMIMLNGVGEIDNFSIYDQLGRKFAEYNLASVLLPLPNSLNRHPKFGYKDKSSKKPFDEFIHDPKTVFESYLQIMKEIDLLLNHLKYKPCKNEKKDCSFFKDLFGTKVSILGYSLGGSIALANFMTNLGEYDSCIIINGGVRLRDLNVRPFVATTEWNAFVSNLEHLWHKELSREINNLPDNQQKYSKYFSNIFLGNHMELFKEEIRDSANKILFISAGKDSLDPLKNIGSFEPSEKGFSVFKIPSINHFLSIENEWSKWNDTVVKLINSFIENIIYDETITTMEIIEGLIKLDYKYKIIDKELTCSKSKKCSISIKNINKDKIKDENDKKLFDDLLLSSRAYYDEKELNKELSKNLNEYLIGQIAIEKNFINKNQLVQIFSIKKAYPTKKIGELLLSLNFLKESELNNILEDQENFYNYLLK